MDMENLIDALALIAWNSEPKNAQTITEVISLLKEQEDTINELQNAYGYLQKQFFEAQDKLLKKQEAEKKCCKDCEYYGNCHDT